VVQVERPRAWNLLVLGFECLNTISLSATTLYTYTTYLDIFNIHCQTHYKTRIPDSRRWDWGLGRRNMNILHIHVHISFCRNTGLMGGISVNCGFRGLRRLWRVLSFVAAVLGSEVGFSGVSYEYSPPITQNVHLVPWFPRWQDQSEGDGEIFLKLFRLLLQMYWSILGSTDSITAFRSRRASHYQHPRKADETLGVSLVPGWRVDPCADRTLSGILLRFCVAPVAHWSICNYRLTFSTHNSANAFARCRTTTCTLIRACIGTTRH
jgi:hypothetical protein